MGTAKKTRGAVVAGFLFLSAAFFAALPAPADAQANQDNLAQANTAFAFDLFKQIAGGAASNNVFISPYSVSAVLQMVDDGAAGQTKQQMDRALHLDGVSPFNAAAKSLDQDILSGQNGITLSLANSLWYEQGAKLKPSFVSDCDQFFRAKCGALDFTSPQSARTINDWAERNTGGRIKNVVAWPIDPQTRIILANAIYFKGHWAREFEKQDTKDHAFTLSSGKEEQVPMMQQSGRFAYFEGPGFQAARLPYTGGRLQMYLFLPGANSDIKQLLAGFDGDAWKNKITPQFRERAGQVMLPRFQMDYGVDLNKSLKALGIQDAFSSAADFSGMSPERLYLSDVKQKSFVDVNEEGTEAAAATTATVNAMVVMRPQPPFEMILDRPFFFVIGDESAHSILFMGIVSDPGAAMSH